MRTKDEMRQEWLRTLGGLRFAEPVLVPGVPPLAPTAFSFVVAAVHPFAPFRTAIESDDTRLRLARSAVSIPQEPANAAFDW